MEREVIGVIPAAGTASRLGSLPFSKEVFPLRFEAGADGGVRPTVAAEYLLEGFRRAGADRAYVILREGKWDIPACLADGERAGIPVGYLMMRFPYGQPFTVEAARPFVAGATVLFGFPDIVFRPEDAFVRLLERLRASSADVVLGLFGARDGGGMDLVERDAEGSVRRIEIKPDRTKLRETWMLAVWTPAFTELLHHYVAERLAPGSPPTGPGGRELYMGDVFQAGIDAGMTVDAVSFEGGTYLDIGTPDDLREALRTEMGDGP